MKREEREIKSEIAKILTFMEYPVDGIAVIEKLYALNKQEKKEAVKGFIEYIFSYGDILWEGTRKELFNEYEQYFKEKK